MTTEREGHARNVVQQLSLADWASLDGIVAVCTSLFFFRLHMSIWLSCWVHYTVYVTVLMQLS